MNTNFILNPYYNLYKNNKLVNQIRNILLSMNNIKMNKTQNDYKLIEECLEQRFVKGIDNAFLESFGVILNNLDLSISFDESYFTPEDVLYNQRYGTYINNALNQVLTPFNIKLNLEPKNMLFYEIFIETCNIYSQPLLWENVKKTRNISTPYEYLLGRLSAEKTGHLYENYYLEIINTMKYLDLSESNKLIA